jgi:glycosyltransferase involved in cell wall biosynthesis
MRIACLVSEYPAPSHTFIRREIDELRRRGLEVSTFSIRKPIDANVLSDRDRYDVGTTSYVLPPRIAALLEANLQNLAKRPLRYVRTLFDAFHHRVPGARSQMYALFYFQEAMLLARELEERQVEHLHNHFANTAAIVGFLATRYLDLPWSLTLHGISCFDYPSGLLLEKKVAHAAFVACVTHFGRAQAYRTVDPALWPKLFVSRCGIDLSTVPKKRARPGARLRFLAVGRISPEKGHIGLIDAFAEAVTRGLDADLDLIGDGPGAAAVEERVRARGLESCVTLLGRLAEEEVLAEMAGSDVLVLSSFMEGLPVVLIEALALELAVIAPCVAGIPELIVHGETGLLFAPGNWPELARRMLEVSVDGALRERLGAAGRAKVEEEFAIDRAVSPILERFATSAGGSRR